MRLSSPLIRRLERLEAVLKPVGRMFCMFDFELGDEGFVERERAFRAENAVGPNDVVHLVRFSFAEHGHGPGGS
jgi:hypothetical protein